MDIDVVVIMFSFLKKNNNSFYNKIGYIGYDLLEGNDFKIMLYDKNNHKIIKNQYNQSFFDAIKNELVMFGFFPNMSGCIFCGDRIQMEEYVLEQLELQNKNHDDLDAGHNYVEVIEQDTKVIEQENKLDENNEEFTQINQDISFLSSNVGKNDAPKKTKRKSKKQQ
jgi:hypothetical protein